MAKNYEQIVEEVRMDAKRQSVLIDELSEVLSDLNRRLGWWCDDDGEVLADDVNEFNRLHYDAICTIIDNLIEMYKKYGTKK